MMSERTSRDSYIPTTTLELSTVAGKSASRKSRKLVKKSKSTAEVANKLTETLRDASRSSTNSGKDSTKTNKFKSLNDLVLGSKVSGKVVDVCEFGAFVNIGYATRGSRTGTALLHISQIGDNWIKESWSS